MQQYTLLTYLLLAIISTNLTAQSRHEITANPNNTFTPNALTIEIGDTVSWINNGGFHNINGSTLFYPDNPEGFNNGDPASAAWTFEFVFTQAGTYDYHCDPHQGVGMIGTITVNAPAGDIVISEIMYNPPGSDADLEYLELYNAGANAVNLIDYAFSGFDFTFPGFNLAAGEYVIVAADSAFFEATFGIPAFEMDGGGLTNAGELIQLLDGSGAVVDEVEYGPSGDWAPAANGLGASLVLCDPGADNNDPANWDAATSPTGILISGFELFANPAAAGQCTAGPTVALLTTELRVEEDAGTITIPIALSEGDPGANTTVAIGISPNSSAVNGEDFDFTPTTVTFEAGALQDTVFLSLIITDDMDIEPLENIVLELANPSAEAAIDVFAGVLTVTIQDNDAVIPRLVITEIMYNPPESGTDSLEFIELLNNGDAAVDLTGYFFSAGVSFTFPEFTLAAGDYVLVAINPGAIFNLFGENALPFAGALSNGGELIQLSNPGGTVVTEVNYDDGAPWPTGAGGTGPSIVLCNPDADSNNGANWATSAIDTEVIINGQVVLASPGGADSCAPPMEVNYPGYDIGVVNTVNVEGVADSIGVGAQLQGIVYGVNLRPGGLEFTLIDAAGDGIGVFSNSEDFGYTVQEGDEIVVRGAISQYNGLTQIGVDTLDLVSFENTLLEPLVVTELGEATESQLIRLENVTLADPGEWNESGGSFNVSVTDGTNTYLVRIDDDVDIAGTPAPGGAFNITGIGGQFDNSQPYTEGYQLLPRYLTDLELVSKTVDPALGRFIRAYPNPAGDYLQLRLTTTFEALRVHNALGQQLLMKYDLQPDERLDISDLAEGLYTLTLVRGNRLWSTQFVKQ